MSGYFSVQLDVRARRCLVVGGGPVGERKVRALLEAGADQVMVVAPEPTAELAALADSGRIELRRRPFSEEDLEGAFVALVATDDAALNQRVAAAARARQVLVNVADDPAECDFILPAVVRQGDLEIAISTAGRSPAFARYLRELLERLIGPEYRALLDITAEARTDVRARGLAVNPETWQAALRSADLTALRAGEVETARARLRGALGLEERQDSTAEGGAGTRTGCIALVGAGPGDPGLLTLAGQAALAQADVVVYDRLVNPQLLALAPPSARRIYAGKDPNGEGPLSQDEINRLLCAEALDGKRVVRLKGGDPFVFGRGGEEALAAVRAGVPFTVVPGVTAAIGVPAYAGIPVTHRGLSSAFTVITGYQDPSTPPIDLEALARLGGTIVLLMGLEPLPRLATELIEAGLAAETPAVVIERGALPGQRTVRATLADVGARAAEAGLRPPVTTVVGAVAGLADQLAWWPEPAAGGRAAAGI